MGCTYRLHVSIRARADTLHNVNLHIVPLNPHLTLRSSPFHVEELPANTTVVRDFSDVLAVFFLSSISFRRTFVVFLFCAHMCVCVCM